jgi:hypothetical protein
MLHEQESVGRTKKMFGSSYKNGNKSHLKQHSYCYIWANSPLSFCEYVSSFIMLNMIIYCLELFVVQKLHVSMCLLGVWYSCKKMEELKGHKIFHKLWNGYRMHGCLEEDVNG